LSKKLYVDINQATKGSRDELLSQGDKLMNKMIPWLQNERDQHFANERRTTLQFLGFHLTAADRASPKTQGIDELIIKHMGLGKLLKLIGSADNFQLVIVEQDASALQTPRFILSPVSSMATMAISRTESKGSVR
jgi:hypothetical protein